jgi:hypothetical protein
MTPQLTTAHQHPDVDVLEGQRGVTILGRGAGLISIANDVLPLFPMRLAATLCRCTLHARVRCRCVVHDAVAKEEGWPPLLEHCLNLPQRVHVVKSRCLGFLPWERKKDGKEK